jgi:hypothetical protein
LEAIAAMQLTRDDLATWAEENGMGLPAFGGGWMGGGQELSDEEREAMRATMEASGAPPGGGGGGWAMSDEEREAMRATMEASGAPPGGGGSGWAMSDEEREAMRATMEASGGMPAGGRPGAAGRGTINALVAPLVELLTQRAAE